MSPVLMPPPPRVWLPTSTPSLIRSMDKRKVPRSSKVYTGMISYNLCRVESQLTSWPIAAIMPSLD